MLYGKESFADPLPLLKTLVDDQGKPIPIGEQQDLGEFMHLFTDWMERAFNLFRTDRDTNMMDDLFQVPFLPLFVSPSSPLLSLPRHFFPLLAFCSDIFISAVVRPALRTLLISSQIKTVDYIHGKEADGSPASSKIEGHHTWLVTLCSSLPSHPHPLPVPT